MGDGTDGEWVSLHVFYSGDADPMIVEAVRPLVARLREDGLIEAWFFIKYWKGGPHLRLRFKPVSAEVREEVTTRAVDAIQEFLTRRPALFDIYTDAESRGRIYKKMYVAEYGAESWNQEYGVAGQMPFEPNNSIAMLSYEPEYDRYGGEVGIQIAEWHFEQSSDLTSHLLAVSNTHVRPVLLGLATQLMLMSAYTFLGEDAAVHRFFQRYRTFWETAYGEPTAERHAVFDRSFELTHETFEAKLARIRTLANDGTDQPSGIERAWLTHSRNLRDRVRAAAAQGELSFRSPADGEPTSVPYGERLITVLLNSYVHMTNNRLGTSPGQEAYLSTSSSERWNPAPWPQGSVAAFTALVPATAATTVSTTTDPCGARKPRSASVTAGSRHRRRSTLSPPHFREFRATAGRLIDAAGHGVDLCVTGYQFPDTEDLAQRHSWHMVEGTATCPEGSWPFRYPALTCDESPYIATWLRDVVRGQRSPANTDAAPAAPATDVSAA